MNNIIPFIPNNITARKILVDYFNMSAPPLEAEKFIERYGEEAYPKFANRLSYMFRTNRDINQLWSETLKNVFAALTDGITETDPMIANIQAELTLRDELFKNEEINEAKFMAACEMLKIKLEA